MYVRGSRYVSFPAIQPMLSSSAPSRPNLSRARQGRAIPGVSGSITEAATVATSVASSR